MRKTLSAVIAGVAGKIILGATVAAASVGGMHAAGVADFPGLPDQAHERAVEATRAALAEDEGGADDDAESQGDENPAVENQEDDAELEETESSDDEGSEDEGSEDESEAADEESEFSQAMQAWSDCVDAASAEHDQATAELDASVDGPPEAFDPENACGPRPVNEAAGEQGPPQDIMAMIAAIQEWAACVADNAPAHADACGTNPAADRAGGSQAPEGTPGGPPEGTPGGPPEGTPGGPPEGTPGGPPEGVPARR